MRLTLAIYPVHTITMGDATRLDGTSLRVDGDELKQLILEDSRLQGVDLPRAADASLAKSSASQTKSKTSHIFIRP